MFKVVEQIEMEIKAAISCTYFDLKRNCLQCLAKTKKLTLLFQYFWGEGIVSVYMHVLICCLSIFNDSDR